jgi:hypothetical protein
MSSEPPHPERLPTEVSVSPAVEATAEIKPPPGADVTTALGQPPPVSSLTPEEQMALFEKELKEKDWGHQPC